MEKLDPKKDAASPDVVAENLDRMRDAITHALGLDRYGRGCEYRNHYVAEEGGCDFAELEALQAQGLVVRHGPSQLFGDDQSYCFVVTRAGKRFVHEHAPKPPKMSRAQKRYLRWLEISDAVGMSFGEWLKAGAECKD